MQTTMHKQVQQQVQQHPQQGNFDVNHMYDHGDGTAREIPIDFKITKHNHCWWFGDSGILAIDYRLRERQENQWENLGKNVFRGATWKTTSQRWNGDKYLITWKENW